MGSSSENIGNDQAELSRQLWSECVSLTVKVPRVGDRVFYFPQGHLEQVVACMKEGSADNVPSYDLPSKIQCKVVDVQFKAVRGSEEVYAEITLLPDCEESEGSSSQSIFEKVHMNSFCKVLTDSDVTVRGGCSLPKRHVEDIFPLLDTTQHRMSQEVIAKDLHGETWKLQHIYSGTPKRHQLASGWNKVVTAKELVRGDTCIFMKGLEQNELYIGVRPAVTRQKSSTKMANKKRSTNLTCVDMQRGILLEADRAIKTRTPFTVYYYPQTYAAAFVVGYDDVKTSLQVNYIAGLKFEMLHDIGTHVLQKFSGQVTGKQDIDPEKWCQSEWRCLQVCWNTLARGLGLPNRVSPWSIQTLGFAPPCQHPSIFLDQRPFQPIISHSAFPRINGLLHGSGIRDITELTLEMGSSLRQEETNMKEIGLTLEMGSSSRQEETNMEETDLTLERASSSRQEETNMEEIDLTLQMGSSSRQHETKHGGN